MNCDEAFELLTSPAATEHAALREHLEYCPRCREMEQVLEPALSLFQTADTLPVGVDADAAHRQPFLSTEAIQVADSAAARLRPTQAKWPGGFAVLVTAAAVLLVMASWFPGAREDAASQANTPATADACLWSPDTASQNKQEFPGDAREVILSCVSCHLSPSIR